MVSRNLVLWFLENNNKLNIVVRILKINSLFKSISNFKCRWEGLCWAVTSRLELDFRSPQARSNAVETEFHRKLQSTNYSLETLFLVSRIFYANVDKLSSARVSERDKLRQRQSCQISDSFFN